jgi:hypothetical protein
MCICNWHIYTCIYIYMNTYINYNTSLIVLCIIFIYKYIYIYIYIYIYVYKNCKHIITRFMFIIEIMSLYRLALKSNWHTNAEGLMCFHTDVDLITQTRNPRTQTNDWTNNESHKQTHKQTTTQTIIKTIKWTKIQSNKQMYNMLIACEFSLSPADALLDHSWYD